MKLADRIKAIFAKAQDEALKVATEDEANVVTPETKTGFISIDDFKKGMDALGSQLMGAIKGGKDASTQPTENAPAEVVAKDEGEESGLAARLTKLEAAVAKLLSGMSTADADKDGDDDEVTDEDGDEDDETTDEDCEDESVMTGDSKGPGDEDDEDDELASRVEILAPGMKATGKNVKAKALAAAYATKDGKAVINQLTGNKALNLKDPKTVDAYFVAASELLKVKRNSDLAETRSGRAQDFNSNLGQPKGAMTPEKINEMNKKHYGG